MNPVMDELERVWREVSGLRRTLDVLRSSDNIGSSGWLPGVATWTYATATSFTVAGNWTGVLFPGVKLRVKQGGAYKYFYVVSSSYAAPTTTVTVTGGSDYSLTNATITDNYYSYATSVPGFPHWFSHSPTWGGFSVNPTAICRFSVWGRAVDLLVSTTGAGTSNATTLTLTAPITPAGINGMTWTVPVILGDNGALQSWWGRCDLSSGSSTITCYRDNVGTGWTASGSKWVAFHLRYEI